MTERSGPEEIVEFGPAWTERRHGRTWGARLVLGVNVLVAIACFGTATALFVANDRVSQRQVVTIDRSDELTTGPSTTVSPDTTNVLDELGPLNLDIAPQNWLVTGVDNGDCVEDGELAAANIGDRSRLGERSDTIMVVRIDPPANQAAILSFPRDLWLRIAGKNSKSRINSAFDGENPSRLVQTIEQNFGVPIDHSISVDFCAFKQIVNAVGGVKVPFAYAVRDVKGTGFSIPRPGCYELGPDAALDYVRSRYYEYFDPETQTWKSDPTSDWGRISRQQDFIRRVLQKALDKGARDPRVAWQLLNAAIAYVVTDDQTTPKGLLELAQAMKNIDPATIRTYTIETKPIRVGNNAVLDPRIEGENMRQVLAVFRGEARLVTAPEQIFAPDETTTTLAPPTTYRRPTSSTVAGSTTSTTAPSTSTSTPTATTSTLPLVLPEEEIRGIVPPDDPTCR